MYAIMAMLYLMAEVRQVVVDAIAIAIHLRDGVTVLPTINSFRHINRLNAPRKVNCAISNVNMIIIYQMLLKALTLD